jgi:transcriptional regulator with XRE-family HTH domain
MFLKEMALAFKDAHLSAYRGKHLADNPALGRFIRESRERARLTQERVARKIDVSLPHYRRMEGGRVANPGPQLIGAMAELFDRPVGDFYAAAGWTHSTSDQLLSGLAAEDQDMILALVRRLHGPVRDPQRNARMAV